MSANYHTNSFYQWGRQGRNTPRIGALQRHENEIAIQTIYTIKVPQYVCISRTDFGALLFFGMYPKVKQKCQQRGETCKRQRSSLTNFNFELQLRQMTFKNAFQFDDLNKYYTYVCISFISYHLKLRKCVHLYQFYSSLVQFCS